jgi:hypothetical protein
MMKSDTPKAKISATGPTYGYYAKISGAEYDAVPREVRQCPNPYFPSAGEANPKSDILISKFSSKRMF